MPAFDTDGNLYFGAHDGCFYSLDAAGRLRWMFKTGNKMYASPVVDGGYVFFTSGDGHLFCFDLQGNCQWSYALSEYFKKIEDRIRRKLSLLYTKRFAYDPDRRKHWTVKCWSSPNIGPDGTVYITALGIGLHAVRARDGKCIWQYDLGAPRHHLSGVALNPAGDIFVASQRRRLHCLGSDGTKKWSYDTGCGFDTWGNPSLDLDHDIVFFPMTQRERNGRLFALNFQGKKKWEAVIDGGIRGSAALSYRNYVAVAGLSGRLYFLDKHSGRLMKKIRLTDARRGMWTTPAIDPDGHILITTKDSRYSGSLCCLSPDGDRLWRIELGKALATPVIDANGRLYVGSWDGAMHCYQT